MNKSQPKTHSIESIVSSINEANSREGIALIASNLLNLLMQKEREIFLRSSIAEESNKANGFYDRGIACNLGNLNLLIPRDRNSSFRSAVMPGHWKRGDESYQEFISNLILQSYSGNKMKSLLSSLNLPYSLEEIEEIKEELLLKAKELKSKQLSENTFCIFIDAYHTQLKDEEDNRVKKAVIYSIISIDLKGRRELCGFYVYFGSESKEDWLCIFNDLITRGLKRTMLIVSDDFSGLKEAIAALFPRSIHQLCFIHMQRNVRRNLGKEDAKAFNEELSLIRKDKSFDSAVKRFEGLCSQYQSKYKTFISKLLEKKNLYFNFIKFPQGIRKNIYTTNVVENFNSRLEVKRVNSGGHFQSLRTIDISIYTIINSLNQGRWKKALPSFLDVEYELSQLFQLQFKRAEDLG